MPRTTITAITALTVLCALSACALGDSPRRDSGTARSASAEPSSVPSPSETNDAQQTLAGDTPITSPSGGTDEDVSQCMYRTADGSDIPVRRGAPTDQRILSDVQRRLDAIPSDDPDDNGTSAADNFQSERSLEFLINGQTCKDVITIRFRRMAVPNPDGTTGGFRWVATSTSPGWWMQWETDRSVLVSKVNAWVDANSPTDWIVIASSNSR